MFDDVILLHDGSVVYHGPVPELPRHFEELGFPCKQNFNPADHVMFLMQKESAETIGRIKDSWKNCQVAKSLEAHVNQKQSARDAPVRSISQTRAGAQVAGFGTQLGVLLQREWRSVFRNKSILGARYGMTLFLALMYAWLFAGTGRTGDNGELGNCKGTAPPQYDAAACFSDFTAHLGSLLSLGIATMMGAAQPVLLTFPSERPVFLREYAANQYGAVAYFVAKTLVELPVIFIASLLQFLVAYWIMGLHGNFILLVLAAWLLAISSSGLALLVGCGVASVEKAMQLAPLVLIPQLLFSGLFVPVGSIPASLRWVQYVVPLKYAVNLFGAIEFWYVNQHIEDTGCTMQTCPGYILRYQGLENQSIKFDDWQRNLGLLIGLYFIFRVLACTLLWRKGKYVF